ncbi:enoyl-CoA hydratase/isomerase family protein [Dasania marina]|uniref:enoyl-CoA hydratase/isomerase family protein n=1 Tax=Dasania marina TaxID=471499 RepID=UPI0003682ACB|nr:enoyl-CoA hydratase/isomerase family protein [Dasania marina]
MNTTQSGQFQTLSYCVRKGVALITLNRESRNNAINAQMSRELPKLWQHFKQDSEAVVAIVTGAGDKAFCSGADIADLPELDMSSPEAATSSMGWTPLQNEILKPVICAVNGMVIGGGLHFIADSDIVLAADHATFFDTHVNVGLVSGLEPVSLSRRMPLEAVLRMALVGGKDRMTAERALQCGLVGEVLPKEQLLNRAFELASLITANCPSAMARTKQAIWAAKQHSLDDALLKAWQQIIEHNNTDDFAEGGRAFLEKRAPKWKSYEPG